MDGCLFFLFSKDVRTRSVRLFVRVSVEEERRNIFLSPHIAGNNLHSFHCLMWRRRTRILSQYVIKCEILSRFGITADSYLQILVKKIELFSSRDKSFVVTVSVL